MWNQLKIFHHKLDKDIPIHVQIELTERCNHKCIFCHNHSDRRQSIPNFDFNGNRYFPYYRLQTLLEELKLAGTTAISFTGTGEPLLYDKIFDIIDLLDMLGIQFSITTNLDRKLNQEELNLLAKAKWVRCSINGYDNKSYKKMHGISNDNSFVRVINNVKQLHSIKDRNAKINISYVISNGNEDGIITATKLFKDISDSISFRHDAHTIRIINNSFNDNTLAQLNTAKLIENENFKVYTNVNRLEEDNVINEDLKCYISKFLVFIAANGDVYPCCTTRWNKNYVYGNIMNISFNDFWDSKERIENFNKLNMRNCPPCRHYQDNKTLDSYFSNEEDNFI